MILCYASLQEHCGSQSADEVEEDDPDAVDGAKVENDDSDAEEAGDCPNDVSSGDTPVPKELSLLFLMLAIF